MLRLLGLALLLLLSTVFGSAQKARQRAAETHPTHPCDAARNQMELNECSAAQFHKADGQLNIVYAGFLKEMQKDLAGPLSLRDSDQKNWNETRVKKLETAQKAWLQYRNLHCEAAEYEYEGGSMSPTIWAQCLTTTTEHRIEELKVAYEMEQRKRE